MIQLIDNLQWDSSKSFNEQDPDVQNFVQNVIATYDRTTTKEPIPNSHLNRVVEARYIGLGFIVVETFEYFEPAIGSGWAAVKHYNITCHAE